MREEQYIVSCQVWEWYGDEDHVGEEGYGRHKPKGGEDFLFAGDDMILYKMEDLIEKFNKKYNVMNRFFRYEAREISFYFKPEPARLVDGEIEIEFS